MVDMAVGVGAQEAGDQWEMRSLEVVDDPKRRLDRLVPLLHEMVAWGLVRLDDQGTFVLEADVQERLARLTTQRPQRTAQVYVGRRCQVCGEVRLTRMVDGVRQCAACGRAAPPVEVAVEPANLPKNRRGPFSWHRWAG